MNQGLAKAPDFTFMSSFLTEVGFANGHTANPSYEDVYTDAGDFPV